MSPPSTRSCNPAERSRGAAVGRERGQLDPLAVEVEPRADHARAAQSDVVAEPRGWAARGVGLRDRLDEACDPAPRRVGF